jgi:solute carrier family 25 phosphate transporter 23/24/25/41
MTETSLQGKALMVATAKKMWVHGGMRDYYRGLTLGLLGIIPYSAIDLGIFEGMSRAYTTAKMKKTGCPYEAAEPGTLFYSV